jgi:hypothetical protein
MTRSIFDDGTKHLRQIQGGRDSWGTTVRNKNGHVDHYDYSISVCERRVWTADTYATIGRAQITCPGCAVFQDAWITAGMKGRLTVRRVRSFVKEHRLTLRTGPDLPKLDPIDLSKKMRSVLQALSYSVPMQGTWGQPTRQRLVKHGLAKYIDSWTGRPAAEGDPWARDLEITPEGHTALRTGHTG